MLLDIVTLAAGITLLIKGADWLVDGGSALANKIGVSHLVIGLTIVSFGTSAPELLVNIVASLKGNAQLAIANIVGSNIANTLLILGITAVITPLIVRRSTVFKEIPFCLLAAVVLFAAANDRLLDNLSQSALHRTDGLIFLGFFVIFMYYIFGIRHNAREENNNKICEDKLTPVWQAAFFVITGCFCLCLGGPLTVHSAEKIALSLNINDALVGLTAVAVGTSLPELVTSVVAARRGNADIAIGNVVGSNIFNIFWILGISATIKPIPFKSAFNIDLVVMVLSTLLLVVFVNTGTLKQTRFLRWVHLYKNTDNHLISRAEGWILLFLYFAYILYIVIRG